MHYDEGNEADFLEFEAIAAIDNLESAIELSPEDQRLADEFEAFFSDLHVRHFAASEFLTLGASHNGSGRCGGKNKLPPAELWPNATSLIKTMDEIRERLGTPVKLTNVFRAEDYNLCVGGVSRSQHRLFKAADFVAREGTSANWAETARAARADGVFSGGVGVYRSFVHVDVRGTDADWDKR